MLIAWRHHGTWMAGFVIAALAAAAPPMAQQPCLTASKFGPTDQVGALNNVTPAKTLAATKLVTRGKAYGLGIETNKDTPAFPPRTFSVTILQPGQAAGTSLGPTKTTYNDDIITGWVGIGSQLDGLGHIGVDNLYYNCNKAADFAMADGLKKLGIENVPPDCHARRAPRHGGLLQHRYREGRHGPQPSRDRRRHEAPGHPVDREG